MSYDALDHLTNASWSPAPAQTSPSAASVAFAYRYDQTNRRLGQTATDNSWLEYPAATAQTVSYTANALNQYSAVGSTTPSYDADGDLTYDGSFTYGYDAEGHLTSVDQGGSAVASYAYDAQGRRKSKTVGSATTIYVTDADDREVLEYNGTSGAIGAWYAYGTGPNAVLSRMTGAGTDRATLIPDVQGSIIATLDAASGSLAKAGYQAFGENPTTYTGTFRYAAQRIDPETGGSSAQPSGLYYDRARMYSPTWGRFLQPDPIGYEGGNNLYAYVQNDPLNQTDPLGLCDNAQGCGGSSSQFISTPTVPAAPAVTGTTSSPVPVQLATAPQSGPQNGSPPDQQGSQLALNSPLTCSGPNSSCAVGVGKFKSQTPGLYVDPDNPGFLLCYDCFKKSQGRVPTGEDTPQ